MRVNQYVKERFLFILFCRRVVARNAPNCLTFILKRNALETRKYDWCSTGRRHRS